LGATPYSYLIHCALKGKAGIGNLLRGLDVLKAIDNCREGTIILRKLSMDFCGKFWFCGVVALSKNLSNTLFCTLSIIC
jgi:hypothetical protein